MLSSRLVISQHEHCPPGTCAAMMMKQGCLAAAGVALDHMDCLPRANNMDCLLGNAVAGFALCRSISRHACCP
jgi:hypothetical protein